MFYQILHKLPHSNEIYWWDFIGLMLLWDTLKAIRNIRVNDRRRQLQIGVFLFFIYLGILDCVPGFWPTLKTSFSPTVCVFQASSKWFLINFSKRFHFSSRRLFFSTFSASFSRCKTPHYGNCSDPPLCGESQSLCGLLQRIQMLSRARQRII